MILVIYMQMKKEKKPAFLDVAKKELRARLDEKLDDDIIIGFFEKKCKESFKNGISTARNAASKDKENE